MGKDDNVRNICCIICFIFVFIVILIAIFWTNRDNFENFSNTIKTNNDTILNVLSGGKNYKALNSNDNIQDKLSKLNGKVALVAILAPWCGYCKQLKASKVLTKVASKYPVFVIDDKHPQVRQLMEAIQGRGFPSIGFYYNGSFMPYGGERTQEALLNAMNAISKSESPKTGTVITMPETTTKQEYTKNVNELMKKNDKIVTIFMAPWCGHCKRLKESNFLEQLASKGVIVLAASDTMPLSKEMVIPGFPSIFYMKNKENILYDGERTPDALLEKMN